MNESYNDLHNHIAIKRRYLLLRGPTIIPLLMTIVLSALLSCLLALFGSAAADPLANGCYGGNYTARGAFKSNLRILLASLSSSNATFFTDDVGSAPDRAYGLVLCRGDAGPADCAACIQNAAQDVLTLCPFSRKATVWYDNCQLRYTDLSFLSTVNETGDYILLNVNNATDIESFMKLERMLLDAVTSAAAYNSSLKFATGIAYNDSGSPAIYALAQCTRDLSSESCSRCLQQVRGYYDGRWMRRKGGRVLGQSCNFRYESDLFFGGTPTVSLGLLAPPPVPDAPPHSPPADQPPPAPNSDKGSKNYSRTVLLIVIPVVVCVVFLFIVGICFWWRSAKKPPSDMVTLGDISSSEWLLFNLTMLKAATDNFSESKKLGQGGFGTVYRGTLANGEDIAVKRLSASSRQGMQELKNELILVAKLQHKNLVRLRGACLEGDEKLLVYEYVPNRSLDNFLFDPAKCKQLNWEIRFKIILGIAQGLLYLHEESHLKVIHRDLKASNVLLDLDMNPKIADFGLARLFAEDDTRHITNRVVGTFGYMAPEYARRGHFSLKMDVYSFGILVLEIVTGKRSNGFKYDSEISRDILSYTWDHWINKSALEIIDPSMGKIFPSNEVLRCIQIALLCTQECPADRPPMSSIFLMLHGPSTSLQEPLQPMFAGGVYAGNSTGSSKQTDLSSSEEFAATSHNIVEDMLLIRQNTWEAHNATRNSVFGRQTA